MRFFIFLSILVLSLCCRTNAEGDVPAQQLLDALKNGAPITGVVFKTGQGYNISINNISTNGVEKIVYWQGDMDIDCDGDYDPKCKNDPTNQTELSVGKGINATVTPFFVIPIKTTDFDFLKHGIKLGQVGAVIYNNKVIYGTFLDECGVPYLIGEASYAMAALLGIDPDPAEGGIDKGVTYIVFSGTNANVGTGVSNYANHQKAIDIGNARAKEMVGTNTRFNSTGFKKPAVNEYQINLPVLSIKADGNHSISVFNFKGENVLSMNGMGKSRYNLSQLTTGLYLIKINVLKTSYTGRVTLF
jgi:hypothetical protein